MTDPKGDRTKASHDRADPDMFVHVVDLVFRQLVMRTGGAAGDAVHPNLSGTQKGRRAFARRPLRSEIRTFFSHTDRTCWYS